MPEREFNITISPDGSVELHVRGYKGKRCLEVAKMFEDLVGELRSTQETNEFYEPDEQVRYRVENKG